MSGGVLDKTGYDLVEINNKKEFKDLRKKIEIKVLKNFKF